MTASRGIVLYSPSPVPTPSRPRQPARIWGDDRCDGVVAEAATLTQPFDVTVHTQPPATTWGFSMRHREILCRILYGPLGRFHIPCHRNPSGGCKT